MSKKGDKCECLRCEDKFERSEEYRLCYKCRRFAEANSEREEYLSFAVPFEDNYSIYDQSFD